ncbi:MAG: hypothetical protein LC685_04365, partial [Actinobacteria bacterium]|nr:hypothetical protein [Actinomycetota bacterium]
MLEIEVSFTAAVLFPETMLLRLEVEVSVANRGPAMFADAVHELLDVSEANADWNACAVSSTEWDCSTSDLSAAWV